MSAEIVWILWHHIIGKGAGAILPMMRPRHSPGLLQRKTVFELESIHLKAVRHVCHSLAVIGLGIPRQWGVSALPIAVGSTLPIAVGSASPIAAKCFLFITLNRFSAGLALPITLLFITLPTFRCLSFVSIGFFSAVSPAVRCLSFVSMCVSCGVGAALPTFRCLSFVSIGFFYAVSPAVRCISFVSLCVSCGVGAALPLDAIPFPIGGSRPVLVGNRRQPTTMHFASEVHFQLCVQPLHVH